MEQIIGFSKRVKIDSLKYQDVAVWRSRIEEVLADGATPVVKNFNREQHLETTIEIAFRHRITIILNPQQTECQFRKLS